FAADRPDRFEGIGYTESEQGLPLLEGVLATIECDKQAETPAGDHIVFIGIVTGGSVTDRKPLLYYRGGYARLSSGCSAVRWCTTGADCRAPSAMICGTSRDSARCSAGRGRSSTRPSPWSAT